MAYRVERSESADHDLESIFDFLFATALDFGEDAATALDRAAARVLAIEDAMEALGQAPHQGTLRPELGGGVRNVTKGRAVIYFEPDDEARLARVLAVFWGGQDHRRRMLLKALARGSDR